MRQLGADLAKEVFREVREEDRADAARIVTAIIYNNGDKGGLDWAMSLPPGAPRWESIEVAASREARTGINIAEANDSFPAGPDRDAALHGSALGFSYTNPRRALDTATQIGDAGIRERALWKIARDWSDRDSGAAAEWIESSPALSAESKVALLRQLRSEWTER